MKAHKSSKPMKKIPNSPKIKNASADDSDSSDYDSLIKETLAQVKKDVKRIKAHSRGKRTLNVDHTVALGYGEKDRKKIKQDSEHGFDPDSSLLKGAIDNGGENRIGFVRNNDNGNQASMQEERCVQEQQYFALKACLQHLKFMKDVNVAILEALKQEIRGSRS